MTKQNPWTLVEKIERYACRFFTVRDDLVSHLDGPAFTYNTKLSPQKPKIEFAPDVWERFESLVKSAAKMGPRPHDGTRPKTKRAVKKQKAKKAAAR